MKKNSYLLMTAVGLLLTASVTQAATAVDLSQQPASLLQALNTTPVEFKEIHRAVDFNHMTHIRFQQTYSGYRVWGADAVLHTTNASGSLSTLLSNKTLAYSVNGVAYQNLTADLGTAPAYIFQPAQADKALQQMLQLFALGADSRGPISQPQKELLVYIDKQSKAHWAFLVSFVSAPATGMPKKPVYLIDAITFQPYENWNDVKTLQEAVDGGGYGGNLRMGKLTYDSLTAHLPKLTMLRNAVTNICYVQNSEVTVVDRRNDDTIVTFKCPTLDSQHKEYWDADLDAVNGGYSPSNDALYAGKVIKAMYQQWYQVPVLVDENGEPLMLIMRVHEYEDNAYWFDGAMTFGDGITDFYPLVSLGVAGHEISHGFTEQWSGLVYTNQSGGLNESFSDMAAQAAEYYSAGKNSWQIGGEVLKAKGESLRYMDEPTKDCKGKKPGTKCSISNAKDYKNGLDVHYSSGVFNKLFYLLGTTKNWDTRKAFDVMIQANMNYWVANATFTNAACGVLSAAKDLKYDLEAVKTAANKVGIDTGSCK